MRPNPTGGWVGLGVRLGSGSFRLWETGGQVQAGVRRLERGFRVNQAVFQNFGTGRGGIVSARLYHTADKHTTLIL